MSLARCLHFSSILEMLTGYGETRLFTRRRDLI